jgi:hypothetical protein
MKQAFNVKEYSKIREEAKQHFLNKKTGDPDLFTEQSKLYKPIIQSRKDLEKSLISGQHELIKQTLLSRRDVYPSLSFTALKVPTELKL